MMQAGGGGRGAGGRVLCEYGNTSVKFSHAGRRWRTSPNEAAAWLAQHGDLELVLTPTADASALAHRCVRIVGRDIPLPDLGQYPGMGLDRILAGLAAGPRCIVIDAGTATTLTAWDDAGRFAGGLILPGVHALVAGLVARAPALPAVTPLPSSSPAAQRDTRGAIAAGAGIGHAAMVRGCLDRLRLETTCPRTVLTGGGMDDFAIDDAERRPWLVLEGLELLVSVQPPT